jgi:ABC-type antimicrobial peptide transport system permease subunit
MNLYVKASSDPRVLAGAIEDVVHKVDPRQSIGSIRSLNDIKHDILAPPRLRAALILLFGLLALAVTLAGVIGAVSYDIGQRVREIGIHIAVGADPARIGALFMSRGLQVYLCGLLLGMALMLAAAPPLSSLLYETSARDAGIYLASAAVLSMAVMGALYAPVRRASRLSPTDALNAK